MSYYNPRHLVFCPEKVSKGTFHWFKETPQMRAPWRRAGTLKLRIRPTNT